MNDPRLSGATVETAGATASDLPGLDLQALGRWLDGSAPGLLSGPLTGSLVSGGKSNLTYRVTDGTRSVIVRRPPLGHVLATAHDMAREYRVMAALADTPVPVPAMYALCAAEEAKDVLGAPFYVMEPVDGTPYRTREELEALGAERTRAIADRFVDTLADLHLVDPAAVGLDDFGRPDGFLARQVRRWGQQAEASRSRDLPDAQRLHSLLEQSVPPQSRSGVVHGDYRLDNVLVDGSDDLTAVLDWEMATLGDPLTDVALLFVYQAMADQDLGSDVATASKAPGWPSEAQIAQRYAARSGRDLSSLGFYKGLAFFKIAVILEGIHYRYVHGQTVGEGFERVGLAVEPLLAMGLDALKENR